MSTEQNLKVVRELEECVSTGDFERIFSYYTDDIVWRIGVGAAEGVVPYFGVFRGKAEIRRCIQLFKESPIKETSFELGEHFAVDDRVFSFGRATYLNEVTGHIFGTDQSYMKVFRDGLVSENSRALDTAAFYLAYLNAKGPG